MNPVAGVLRIPSGRFLLWNVVGGLIWTEGILLAGYYLAKQIIRVIPPDKIDLYILPAIVVIIVISLIPIFVEILRTRRANRRAAAVNPAPREPSSR
jgi:membrane-associated protein